MFHVFSASGPEGADGRVLSSLALSLKNSLILGCDSENSSEFRGVIRVTFFFLFTDIIHSLSWFSLNWEKFQRPDYSDRQKATNFYFYRWQHTNTANDRLIPGALASAEPPNTAADPYPGAIWNYRCTGIFTS